ncbi:MAG: hypothetical protein KatS3mg077_2843 [Candidatus Binatia bacterium]|nr:MAG: hypothetical protein KatS3mg077_2843 [Candidatus Binatia bacterium]
MTTPAKPQTILREPTSPLCIRPLAIRKLLCFCATFYVLPKRAPLTGTSPYHQEMTAVNRKLPFLSRSHPREMETVPDKIAMLILTAVHEMQAVAGSRPAHLATLRQADFSC